MSAIVARDGRILTATDTNSHENLIRRTHLQDTEMHLHWVRVVCSPPYTAVMIDEEVVAVPGWYVNNRAAIEKRIVAYAAASAPAQSTYITAIAIARDNYDKAVAAARGAYAAAVDPALCATNAAGTAAQVARDAAKNLAWRTHYAAVSTAQRVYNEAALPLASEHGVTLLDPAGGA